MKSLASMWLGGVVVGILIFIYVVAGWSAVAILLSMALFVVITVWAINKVID